MSLDSLLAQANEVQEDTKAASKSGGFVNEDIPDGDYSAQIVGAEYKPNDKKGLIFELTLQVLEAADPENEGAVGEQVTLAYFPLAADTKSPGFLKRDLEWMGFSNELTEELPQELVDAEITCDVHIRVKDGYQNVFINDVTSSAVATQEGSTIVSGAKVYITRS